MDTGTIALIAATLTALASAVALAVALFAALLGGAFDCLLRDAHHRRLARDLAARRGPSKGSQL